MVTFTVFNYRKHEIQIVRFLGTYIAYSVIMVLISFSVWFSAWYTYIWEILCVTRVFLSLVAVGTQFICSIALIFWRFEMLTMAFRYFVNLLH